MLAALCAALLLAGPAAAASDLREPPSQTDPPRFFVRSAKEVVAIAERASKVRQARRDGALAPTAYTNGVGRWQVSFFRDGRQVVQVQVDDRSGALLEQWTGDQVAWTMARGYEGAFGRKINAPYVWLPLCLLFLAPFVHLRRPFRLLHLDLLVLLSFGVSHVYFNRGEIGTSVPLVYPVLIYLLARMLFAGLRPRARAGPLVPHASMKLLVIGLVFLLSFRVALNVVDSNVIDVGYAGVIGADRIMDGDRLYGKGFSRDVESGDTYGPLTYLAYVPFEQVLPWSGRWDDLPAAHGAAILFDLLAAGGLLLLGRRLRPGREGRMLGVALAYAWAAYPYTAFSLETNSNDSLVSVACVAALLALTLDPPRTRLSALARGMAVGAGAAVKFAPLALAPLFATAPGSATGAYRPRPARRAGGAGGHGAPLRARRRPARALRPDGGLPGRPPVALQHLGPGLDRMGPHPGQGGGGRAGRGGGVRAAAQVTAPGGRARRGGADRASAAGHALVLSLRGLVRALRVRRRDDRLRARG